MFVWIGLGKIERRVVNAVGAGVDQDQTGIEEGLVQEVVMDVLGEVPSRDDVAWRRLPAGFAPGWHAGLNLQPLWVALEKVVSYDRTPILLFLPGRADRDRLPE